MERKNFFDKKSDAFHLECPKCHAKFKAPTLIKVACPKCGKLWRPPGVFTRADLVDFLLMGGMIVSSLVAGFGMVFIISAVPLVDWAGVSLFLGFTASFVGICVYNHRRDKIDSPSIWIAIYLVSVGFFIGLALIAIYVPGLLDFLSYFS